MALFEGYKNHPDPIVRERANNWAIAIGLQRVDGLNVSDFLIEVARQEIEGKVSMNVVQAMIDEHYAQTNSNRTSQEIVPPDLEESKKIADFNKAKCALYAHAVRTNCARTAQLVRTEMDFTEALQKNCRGIAIALQRCWLGIMVL